MKSVEGLPDIFRVLIVLALLVPFHSTAQYDKFDSGWVSLYHGNFDNMKIYTRNKGYIPQEDKVDHETWTPEGDVIDVCCSGNNGLLAPDSNFSFYWVRVKYQWYENAGNGDNAGIMVHVDLESEVTSDNRPASAELNMRRDKPGSVWMARDLGPSAYSYVNENNRYTPEEEGGRYKLLDPRDEPSNSRMMDNCCDYNAGDIEVDNDGNAWNEYLAKVYGGDSVIAIINGSVMSRIYDLRTYDENVSYEDSPPTTSGSIGLQWEGADIRYKEFELIGVDPVTRLRQVPACTDEGYEEAATYLEDFPPDQFTLKPDESKCLTPVNSLAEALTEKRLLKNLTVTTRGSQVSIHIEGYHGGPVSINDLADRTLTSGITDGEGNFYVSKSFIPRGFYFIRLQGNHRVVSRQLILD